MKNEFSEIKEYINGISLYDNQDNFEYNHFSFIEKSLSGLTATEENDFIDEIFHWSDYQQYIIARFLDFTDFALKGKYNSAYVYCECFAKINDVEYLKGLAENLEIQLIFCPNKNELSINDIINNLYLVINNCKDEKWIDAHLKIIDDLNNNQKSYS